MPTSRGGGYDTWIDKQSQKRKAFGSDTRQEQSVGAQATPASALTNPQAPSSLGDLMTPSTGRVVQAAAPEEYDARVQENSAFLSDPTTQGQMMQFAITMLGGGSPGSAISKAMQMPGRMEMARDKRVLEERKVGLQDRGLDLEERKLALEEKEFAATGGKGKTTPTELSKLLDEAAVAEANGQHERAALLRSSAYQKSQEFSIAQGQYVTMDEKGVPTLKNFEGGKADLEYKAYQEKEKLAKAGELNRGLMVSTAANDAFNVINEAWAPDFTVTGWGGLMNWVPASGSKTLMNSLLTIKSNATVAQLQAVREASPTGGAFGNISNYEDQLLASTVASLDQTMTKDALLPRVKTLQFMFDVNTMEQRNAIAAMVDKGEISTVEGQNAYQQLMSDYVYGSQASATGQDMDLNAAPVYVPDDIRQDWKYLDPQDRFNLLSPEDKERVNKPKFGVQ